MDRRVGVRRRGGGIERGIGWVIGSFGVLARGGCGDRLLFGKEKIGLRCDYASH